MILRKLKEAIDEIVKEYEKKKLERERIKRRSQRYGQTKEKHAKRGVSSCLMAGLTLFFLVSIFSASYINRGDVGILIGLMGVGTFVMSVVGFRRALEGFKERNKNYLTCKIGVVCNGAFLLGLLAIFIRGLF